MVVLHIKLDEKMSTRVYNVMVQKTVVMITIPVILVSCVTTMISAFAFHDHHHRKAFVGSVGLIASISMYGSPLVVMVSFIVFFKSSRPNLPTRKEVIFTSYVKKLVVYIL